MGTLKGLSLALVTLLLVGCAGIPPEQQKNYAFIKSGVNEGVSNAPIAYVNRKVQFPSYGSIDVLPGEYQFQLGLNCGNTATCRPSSPYELTVEAGKQYVLLRNGAVMVSDRFAPGQNETPYRAKNN